jgi:hypothetical protein
MPAATRSSDARRAVGRLAAFGRYSRGILLQWARTQPPAKDVALLTPRLWKARFGENPVQSDIDRKS